MGADAANIAFANGVFTIACTDWAMPILGVALMLIRGHTELAG